MLASPPFSGKAAEPSAMEREPFGAYPMPIGTLDASIVHPREIFREAAGAGAAAIVLFHNHPSGDPSPSPDDLALTTRMVNAGDIMGIDVVDHVILADQKYFSLVEAGRLAPRME